MAKLITVFGATGAVARALLAASKALATVVRDACKKAAVRHLVYSGLELLQDIIGKPCPHFDAKGIVEKYLDEIGVPNTSTRYPFYLDNFASSMMSAQKQDDGTYSFTLPMDGIGVEDGGPAVASIFANPDEFIGKKIGFSGDKLTIQQYMDVVAKLTGKTIKYNQVTPDQFAQFPFPGAAGMADMFDFYSRGNPECDLVLTKRLNPGVRSCQLPKGDWSQVRTMAIHCKTPVCHYWDMSVK